MNNSRRGVFFVCVDFRRLTAAFHIRKLSFLELCAGNMDDGGCLKFARFAKHCNAILLCINVDENHIGLLKVGAGIRT